MTLLDIQPTRVPDIQTNSRFSISSSAHPQQFTDLYGNVARRVQIGAGLLNLRHRAELHDSGKHGRYQMMPLRLPFMTCH